METDLTTKIGSIGQIMIPVHDLRRAVAFYKDKLGLQFLDLWMAFLCDSENRLLALMSEVRRS